MVSLLSLNKDSITFDNFSQCETYFPDNIA